MYVLDVVTSLSQVLMVRNLTDDVGEEELKETFGQFGTLEKVGGGE